ncbi:MAG: serine/threonine protein kinase bacterial [Nitrospirae bacterium]|nr:MAG: serine/threonine protein kinase bacterial [Nitrospirota bacterium]
MQREWILILFDLLSRFNTPFIEETALNSASPAKQANTGLLIIFLIILIPVLAALFFLVGFIYKNTIGKKLKTTLTEDYKNEAAAYEKEGKFVSAASVYENKFKDYKKAAVLYEKGKDYQQAARLYEFLGMTQKAKELHEKEGNIEASAEVSMQEGEYEEAAKLYDKAGKKIEAAIIMERAGRRLAAAKAYREAGEYKRASVLLEKEGLVKEAVEMFGFSLRGQKPDSSNIEDFYLYAFNLEKIGEAQKALDIFREIDKADPAFKDVREKIHMLAPPHKEDIDISLEGKSTLRSFIKNGRIEPKYSLKLWVQILKSLQESYNSGQPFGLLSPDNIVIDARNNISFLKRALSSAYISPESTRGLSPDVRADIYSSGVILYEMLTGKLEDLGSTRVIDIVEDVPDWLDEIVIKCIKKVREDRYQGIDDIFTDLKALSKSKKEPDTKSE